MVVFPLLLDGFDRLVLYSILIAAVALIITYAFKKVCNLKFEVSHYTFFWDFRLYKKLLSFSGWSLMGNAANVGVQQGTNILLNLFYGVVVNSAVGISNQVTNAVYSFVSNFMQASNPQITKNFAAGNLDAMQSLIVRSGKFGFYILLLILLPLCANINYVLGIWLTEVPVHTANFVVLILLYSLVDCFVSPLLTGVLAQGNIKSYEIALTFIYLVNFISSYICLKMGMVVETVFILNIIFKACVFMTLLLHSRSKYGLSILRFFKACIIPSAIVFLISSLFVFVLPEIETMNLGYFVMETSAIVIFTGITIWVAGINKKERFYIINMLKDKLKRFS